MSVDEYAHTSTVFGAFTMPSSEELHVAGAPPHTLLAGDVHTHNFRGCLAEVRSSLYAVAITLQ